MSGAARIPDGSADVYPFEMNDEPLDERTAAFLGDLRSTFQVAAAPAPGDALTTLFVDGLANDKGDRPVTAASNANGPARMQAAGLPNWTRRTTDMIRQVLGQASARVGASALGAILAIGSLAAAGAVGVAAQVSDSRMASETTDVEDPADDPSEGAVVDGEDDEGGDDGGDDGGEGDGDADWTGVASPEDCVGNDHGCWVSLAAHNKAGHTCANHGRYVSQVARNKGNEAEYFFDTDCDGELSDEEQAAFDAFTAAAEAVADPAADETDGEGSDEGEIASPADCADANHGCWVSLAAHNKAGHTCANHGRYVSQVAKNKGNEAEYFFDTDCDGELSDEEQAAHDETMGATSSTDGDGSTDADGAVAEDGEAGTDGHAGKGHGKPDKDERADRGKSADTGKSAKAAKNTDTAKSSGKGRGRP